MKIIAILVLIIGIALAGGAIYVANEHFTRQQAAMAALAANKPETTNVLVVKSDLPYGTRLLGNEHLEWRTYPVELVPDGAFTDWETFVSGPDGNTPVLLRQLEKGLPVLRSMVSGFATEQRMAFRLEEGKRAFSIPIDATSGVAGFIAPGDRVDVMLTRRLGQTLESSIIMQNLHVIAVDQTARTEVNNPQLARTATVAVTVTEAQKLAVAQQVGRLSLTLRGNHDSDTVIDTTQTVNVSDVLGIKEVEAPKERVGTAVTLRKGTTVEESIIFND